MDADKLQKQIARIWDENEHPDEVARLSNGVYQVAMRHKRRRGAQQGKENKDGWTEIQAAIWRKESKLEEERKEREGMLEKKGIQTYNTFTPIYIDEAIEAEEEANQVYRATALTADKLPIISVETGPM